MALAGRSLYKFPGLVVPHYNVTSIWRQPPGFAIQGLRFITNSSNTHTNYQPCCRIETVKDGTPVPPPNSGFSNWMKWVWGSLITLLQLPFWKMKWDTFYRLEGKVEKVVEEVETVVEVIEKVATTADKALSEVADQLPEKSKLKETAQVMERASEVVARDAHLIHDIIHKAENVKQELEDLESMLIKGHNQ